MATIPIKFQLAAAGVRKAGYVIGKQLGSEGRMHFHQKI